MTRHARAPFVYATGLRSIFLSSPRARARARKRSPRRIHAASATSRPYGTWQRIPARTHARMHTLLRARERAPANVYVNVRAYVLLSV